MLVTPAIPSLPGRTVMVGIQFSNALNMLELANNNDEIDHK